MDEDADSVDELAENARRSLTMAHQRASCLQLTNLSKFERQSSRLAEISCEIFQGEFICLIGPKGCGKNLLMSLIAGAQAQSAGHIILNGEDISNLPAAKRNLAQLQQSDALRPSLKLRKNIAQGLQHSGLSRTDAKERIAELLDQFSLADLADSFPLQLTPVEQVNGLLARTLADQPGLLLLNDPLVLLGREERRAMRRELKSLQRRLDLTILMVTEDRAEALALGDRIIVLNEGRIAQIGSPTRIYQEPEDLFVASYMGWMNLCPGIVEAPNAVFTCEQSFVCREHVLVRGAECVAMIRPEDIVPLGPAISNKEGGEEENSGEKEIEVAATDNCLEVLIEDMEYSGPVWRTKLTGDFTEEALWADFSANAVRRMGLGVGQLVRVKLPANRLKVIAGARDD